MWQIWLIIAGVCLIGEIMTTGFLVFWLSIGALLSMIVSFFTDNVIIQTAVFVISSAILIFATKPFVKKFAKFLTYLPYFVCLTIMKGLLVFMKELHLKGESNYEKTNVNQIVVCIVAYDDLCSCFCRRSFSCSSEY